MNLHLIKSTFEPAELAEIQSIFDDITGQDWFAPEAKEAFAKHLFETFPASAFNSEKRRSTVEASARMFYSRDA